MSKCGKGCMPECEYFVTCGCISPFNCPYKIEENYQNSAFTSGNSNFLNGIEKWFMQLVEEGKIPQTPMNYDMASYKAYVAHLEAENAELMNKARQLEEQLKAICDKKAKFLSLEQIKKNFLDWTIPFLKAHIASCKEEWFGIDCIAKAIWESIKDDYATAITVDETNAALRERLEKAVELPCKVGDKVYEIIEGEVQGERVENYRIDNMGIWVTVQLKFGTSTILLNEARKIFLTREAAEARLKELGGRR